MTAWFAVNSKFVMIAIPMPAMAATLTVLAWIQFAAMVSSSAAKIVTMETRWMMATAARIPVSEWVAAEMVWFTLYSKFATTASPMPAVLATLIVLKLVQA